MRRLMLFFMAVALVIVAVVGGAVIGLRSSRGKTGPVTNLKPDLVVVTNAMNISLFAARVAPGPHVILFDAGFDPQGAPIDALLAALKASREDVSDVFLTHGHFDHVSGVSVLPNARLHLAAPDVSLAEGKTPPASLLPRFLGFALSVAPVSINAPFTGATTFPVGADAAGKPKTVKAFPVPGHTPGSFAYLYDGVLFTGDIMVVKEGRLETSPRLFNPDPEANKAAIRSLKTQLANETFDTICTAHGGCTPSGLGPNLLDELTSRL
jgi:hydroxyacylglutathione hydrolase